MFGEAEKKPARPQDLETLVCFFETLQHFCKEKDLLFWDSTALLQEI